VTNKLGEKTWEEAKNLVEEQAITVVPVGAFEQHGPHLPLDTDARLVAAVAEHAARVAGERGVPVTVTPPIWTAFSPHHMNFAGTITLSMENFANVVRDVCRCLSKHGFKKIFLLNGHGGNANILRSVIQVLFLEEGIRVAAASYWDFCLSYIKEWRSSLSGGIDHACEMETSLMQYLYPEMVKEEKNRDVRWFPESKYLTGDLVIGGIVATVFSLEEISSTGVAGSPQAATKEKGKELFEEIINKFADFLVEYNSWDWMKLTSGSVSKS